MKRVKQAAAYTARFSLAALGFFRSLSKLLSCMALFTCILILHSQQPITVVQERSKACPFFASQNLLDATRVTLGALL